MDKSDFKNRINKLGFTETEAKVVIFLVLSFILGSTAKYIKDSQSDYEHLNYNYAKIDSIFLNADTDKGNIKANLADKNVDSHAELLDFSKNKLNSETDSFNLNKININKADLSSLLLLPGIGEKTAQKILNYRNEYQSFKSIEELLKVKGIGKAKLEKIRKFLIID